MTKIVAVNEDQFYITGNEKGLEINSGWLAKAYPDTWNNFTNVLVPVVYALYESVAVRRMMMEAGIDSDTMNSRPADELLIDIFAEMKGMGVDVKEVVSRLQGDRPEDGPDDPDDVEEVT